MKIVWIDVETTGLDPFNDVTLEVACIVTDAKLNELGRFESPIHCPKGLLEALLRGNDYVRDMHTKTGLLSRIDPAPSKFEVEKQLGAFLAQHLGGEKGYLAGNSVHFDRGFLAEDLPAVCDHLSHRHLDVSVFKVMASAGWIEETKMGEPRHSAMSDIEGSIKMLRAYGAQLKLAL